MYREIKFRALDDGAIIYSHNNDFNHSNLQNEWFFKTIREDAIIMQYTGLKDKNGKEIYEGDIFVLFGSFKNIIEFNNGSFGYWVYPDKSYRYFISFLENKHFEINNGASNKIEVIGNIYEHPELINSLNNQP
jgi:uncharacterized phage protein (TIGR01671 family)